MVYKSVLSPDVRKYVCGGGGHSKLIAIYPGTECEYCKRASESRAKSPKALQCSWFRNGK